MLIHKYVAIVKQLFSNREMLIVRTVTTHGYMTIDCFF